MKHFYCSRCNNHHFQDAPYFQPEPCPVCGGQFKEVKPIRWRTVASIILVVAGCVWGLLVGVPL